MPESETEVEKKKESPSVGVSGRKIIYDKDGKPYVVLLSSLCATMKTFILTLVDVVHAIHFKTFNLQHRGEVWHLHSM